MTLADEKDPAKRCEKLRELLDELRKQEASIRDKRLLAMHEIDQIAIRKCNTVARYICNNLYPYSYPCKAMCHDCMFLGDPVTP